MTLKREQERRKEKGSRELTTVPSAACLPPPRRTADDESAYFLYKKNSTSLGDQCCTRKEKEITGQTRNSGFSRRDSRTITKKGLTRIFPSSLSLSFFLSAFSFIFPCGFFLLWCSFECCRTQLFLSCCKDAILFNDSRFYFRVTSGIL